MSIIIGPILVVEDIVAGRKLVEVQLKKRGYHGHTAHDGQDALEVIAEEKSAVVVTDILMPRMDGFALAHHLRGDRQTSSVPMIFLLASFVPADDKRFALGLGAMRLLPKPVDADELFIAAADALTGQVRVAAPMAESEFYTGYQQRLESKLQQKSAQISRSQQQMEGLPDAQHETHRRLMAEVQGQYDEGQRELVVLSKLLQELE